MMTMTTWCHRNSSSSSNQRVSVGCCDGCRSRAGRLCDGTNGRQCTEKCRQLCGSWTECGARCTRALLIVVNFVFLVCGILLVGVGVVLYVDRQSQIYSDLLHILPSTGPLVVLEKIPTVFVAIGITVLLLSFLGCYGACVESVCFLWLYTILLFIILATEIIAVTLLAVFRDNILWRLEVTMQQQIANEYNRTALPSNATNSSVLQITSVWDTMQVKLNCCGAVGPQDYKYSAWFNHTKKLEGVFVPQTCCTLLNDDPKRPIVINEDGCQIDAILIRRKSTFLKTRGCGESALQRLAANTSALFCVIFALTILQVVHFLFACSLLTKLRRSLSDYQWYEVNDCGT